MSGNNRGVVAASHSNCNVVVGIEMASATRSSTLFKSILMSAYTAMPPKSTCNSAATDCAREVAVLVADWNTARAFCFSTSRTRSYGWFT